MRKRDNEDGTLEIWGHRIVVGVTLLSSSRLACELGALGMPEEETRTLLRWEDVLPWIMFKHRMVVMMDPEHILTSVAQMKGTRTLSFVLKVNLNGTHPSYSA